MKLLLHACCATCAIAPIELLKDKFDITLFWYNPNVHPKKEYRKRLKQVKKLKRIYKVRLIKGGYESEKWFALTKGFEKEPEGGERCGICFQMRLEKTAWMAHKKSFDYFAATLTTGPQKKAETINRIGEELAQKYNLKFFAADFKKNDGFKKSNELSRKYGFYHQNYCGCAFSAKISRAKGVKILLQKRAYNDFL